MEYVKHKYSGRVYQVKREHGEGSIHLSYSQGTMGRYVRPSTLDRFFIPCKGLVTKSPRVSILREIKWEKSIRSKDQPRRAAEAPREEKSPKLNKHKSSGEKASTGAEYTLKDLCSEVGTTPPVARRILRSHGKSAPDGGWRWSNAKEARGIKKILKKYL